MFSKSLFSGTLFATIALLGCAHAARADEPGCPFDRAAEIEYRLRSLTYDYAARTRGPWKRDAKEEFVELGKYLNSFSEKDPCYQQSRILYLGMALTSQKLGATEVLDTMNQRSSGEEVASPEEATLLKVYVALVRANVIVPIRPSMREAWGGEWSEVLPSGEKKILGAYDCLSGKIYVDAGITPLNLESVIAHEMEHLFRDKLGYFDRPKDYLAVGAKATLLLDESLSAMHAGFIQLQLKRDSNRKTKTSQGSVGGGIQISKDPSSTGWFVGPKGYYRVTNDLNLYREQGGLFQLWKELVKRPEGFPFGGFFRDFLVGVGGLDPRKKDKPMTAILSNLQKAYFPGDEHPIASPRDLDEWISIETAPEAGTLGTVQAQFTDRTLTNLASVDLDRALEPKHLATPSPVCLALQSAITTGDAGGYIGKGVSENGSTRPEGAGGNRPEGAGGNRPGVGIRPCIHIENF